MQVTKKQKSKCQDVLSIEVLNFPFKNTLKQVSSPSSGFSIFQYRSPNAQKLQCYAISISKSKLLSSIQIYEWRNKTEFPIVKTLHVEIKQIYQSQNQHDFSHEFQYQMKNQQKNHYKQKVVQLKIYNEHCPKKLSQIYQLSLNDFIYIAKESFIGFQRLYDRFGGFQVTELMIAINEKGNCKVWINENYGMNQCMKGEQDEAVLVTKILKLLEPHVQHSRTSKKIFTQLKECKSFLAMLKRIQKIIKQHKIILPRRIIFTKPNENKALIKQSKSINFNSFFLSSPSIKSIKNNLQKHGKIRYSIRDSLGKNCKSRDLSSKKSHKSKKSNSIIEPPTTPVDIGYYKIKSSGIKSSDKTFETNRKTLNNTNANTNVEKSINGQSNIKQLKIEDVFVEKREFLSPGRFSFRSSIKNRSQRINAVEQTINVLRVSINKEKEEVKKQERRQNKEQKSNEKGVKGKKFLFHSLDFIQEDHPNTPELKNIASSPEQYLQTPIQRLPVETCKSTEFLHQMEQMINPETPEQYSHPSSPLTFTNTCSEMESQFLEQFKQKVIKNNGWVENFDNLEKVPLQIENSFQESCDGGEETPRSVIFLKLDQIARVKTKKSLIGEDEF